MITYTSSIKVGMLLVGSNAKVEFREYGSRSNNEVINIDDRLAGDSRDDFLYNFHCIK